MKEKVALCVDIGGTTIKFSIINIHAKMLTKVWSIPTNLKNKGEFIPKEIIFQLTNKLKEREYENLEIIGIGIGIPGFATLDGRVKFSGNIGWKNYDIKKEISKYFEVPIFVHNDCDMAALGEKFIGAGKKLDNFVFITLGTGMGAGLIINGKLYLGAGGTAGELGHMPSQGRNPKFQCSCGLKECAEPTFSATGLINIYNYFSKIYPNLKKISKVNGENIWKGVRNNDELCKIAAKEFAEYGGRVLSTTAMVLNPEKIILGGGMSKDNQIMLSYLNEIYKKHTHNFIYDVTKIVLCEVGNDSSLYGAAYSVFKANKLI